MLDLGPEEAYHQALEAGDILPDSAQKMAVSHLQSLFDELTLPKTPFIPPVQRKKSFISWWSGASQESADAASVGPKGLYFWGGVGRGKTWLMDMFYDCLPSDVKSRLHFHRFMSQVHSQLRRLQGKSDPLQIIASEFARKYRILCFDEFFVSDITDAMILSGLLKGLFDQGVILVATSNVHPDELYKNGLQRSKFLPAIELIKKHTNVVNVDGGVDYRLRALEAAELYHSPLDEGADESLLASFQAISPNAGKPDVVLTIEGRSMATRFCGDGVVWFDFTELCDGPRSQLDYIEIARLYQTVLISRVPQLTAQQEDQARRFISLVDEFYDRSVKLILSAEVPLTDLYQGERLVFEFERTFSRLQEMMSHDYLAREHKP